MTGRLFWPCWWLAAVTTGLVAGFMLGHALVLGPFLDWMLLDDRRGLAASYPAFARSAGRGGLTIFYAICGLQVIAALTLLALALAARRHRVGAAVAALTAVLWIAVHYGSGFGAVEAIALRSATPVSADVAARFVAWNVPVHAAHAATLLAGLAALLAMPLASARGHRPRDGGDGSHHS
jgi:hypothetical protein